MAWFAAIVFDLGPFTANGPQITRGAMLPWTVGSPRSSEACCEMGLTIGHTTSAAEEIAKAVPGARVVKAFNTVFSQVLADGPNLGQEKVPVFVAGDDAAARDVVGQLAKSVGFDVIDAGALKNARYLEPLAGLNIYLGYGAGLGTSIAPTFLRKA